MISFSLLVVCLLGEGEKEKKPSPPEKRIVIRISSFEDNYIVDSDPPSLFRLFPNGTFTTNRGLIIKEENFTTLLVQSKAEKEKMIPNKLIVDLVDEEKMTLSVFFGALEKLRSRVAPGNSVEIIIRTKIFKTSVKSY